MIDSAYFLKLFFPIGFFEKLLHIFHLGFIWQFFISFVVIMAKTSMVDQKLETFLKTLVRDQFEKLLFGNEKSRDNQKLNQSLINSLFIFD